MRYSRYRVMDITDGRQISNHSTLELARTQARYLERRNDDRYAVIHYEWVLEDVHVVDDGDSDEFASVFEAIKPLLLEEDMG